MVDRIGLEAYQERRMGGDTTTLSGLSVSMC